MHILSATEAVSPAIARTKLVLFKPFRLGRTWKLSATSEIAIQGTTFFPAALLVFLFLPLIHRSAPAAWIMWAVAFGSLLLIALGVVLFILLSHLQFAFFDIVANRGEFVAPAWRKYSLLHRRWTYFKMIAGSIPTIILGIPVAILFSRVFLASMAQTTHQSTLGSALFIPIFIACLYIGLPLVLLAFSLLNDFMMPPIALENATLAQAWQWVWQQIRTEPGQFALYALLKIVLGFVTLAAVGIIVEIALLIVGLFLIVLGTFAAWLLGLMHISQTVIAGLEITGAIAVLVPLLIYVRIGLGGVAMTFLEAYKLYFLGGRYPMLGDLLDRSTPPPDLMPPAPVSGYVLIAPLPPGMNTP